VHQVLVSTLGGAEIIRVLRSTDDVEPWLCAGWRLGLNYRTAELLVMQLNVAEMVTDWLLYSRYRSFRAGYHLHHLLTVCATVAFVLCETAPVGFVIVFSSLMEAGGAFLNLASLCPCRATYAVRLALYPLSRFLAAAVLAYCTLLSARGHVGVPLAFLAPVWLLMALNLRWATDVLVRAARRQKGDPWALEQPSAPPGARLAQQSPASGKTARARAVGAELSPVVRAGASATAESTAPARVGLEFAPPAGFRVASKPSERALVHSRADCVDADALVGRWLLYKRAHNGWCAGQISRRNKDGRRKLGGRVCNFFVAFDGDADESLHLLLDASYLASMAAAESAPDGTWALLKAV
jgi:hypothetical protein